MTNDNDNDELWTYLWAIFENSKPCFNFRRRVIDALQARERSTREDEYTGAYAVYVKYPEEGGPESEELEGGVIEISDVLDVFARRCALDVAHLWDIPSNLKQCLETGDKLLPENFDAAVTEVHKHKSFAAEATLAALVAKDPCQAADQTALRATWVTHKGHTPLNKYNDILEELILDKINLNSVDEE